MDYKKAILGARPATRKDGLGWLVGSWPRRMKREQRRDTICTVSVCITRRSVLYLYASHDVEAGTVSSILNLGRRVDEADAPARPSFFSQIAEQPHLPRLLRKMLERCPQCPEFWKQQGT
jgi:hypothetical protein